MRGMIVLAVVMVWVGNAQAAPEDGAGVRYLAACSAELQKINLPASVGDCERLLDRSHLIQSEAIRYLAQASDEERQAFGAASTLGRYELISPDINHTALMPQVLNEKETAASGMVGHLVKDIMKPSCGYYQLDILMRVLDDANALPQSPKQAARKPAHVVYKSYLAEALDGGNVEKCLNPIFKPVTLALSPNL